MLGRLTDGGRGGWREGEETEGGEDVKTRLSTCEKIKPELILLAEPFEMEAGCGEKKKRRKGERRGKKVKGNTRSEELASESNKQN